MSNIPSVYRSTDPGAPQLSGQAGAMAAVLDAVLVDGYGGGADAKPPLGWIRDFTAPNKRAYRNDFELYTGNFLRVDDSNALYALVDGYEFMSGIDSGVQRFEGSSAAWAKSSTANSAARNWIVAGTSGCFYLAIETGARTNVWFAGDWISLGANDIWNFAYARSSAVGANALSGMFSVNERIALRTSRSSSGSVFGSTIYPSASLFSGTSRHGAGGFPHPLSSTNGTLFSRSILREVDFGIQHAPRGILPGLWVPEHDIRTVYVHGEQYGDFEGLPTGTQLLSLFNQYGSSPSQMVASMLDLTNPW